MSVNQRLIKFIEVIGENKILEKTNLKSSSLYKVSSGELKNGPRIDTLEAIVSAFPELNETWLLRNIGEMFKIVDEKNGNSSNLRGDEVHYEIKRDKKNNNNEVGDIEILRKSVELLQLEMYKVKQELAEFKKK